MTCAISLKTSKDIQRIPTSFHLPKAAVPPGSPWASHPSMGPWTRRQFAACRMSAECQAAGLTQSFHMCCWEGTNSSPSLQHLRVRRFLGHSFSKRVSLRMAHFWLDYLGKMLRYHQNLILVVLLHLLIIQTNSACKVCRPALVNMCPAQSFSLAPVPLVTIDLLHLLPFATQSSKN